jgi:hypothetical protein
MAQGEREDTDPTGPERSGSSCGGIGTCACSMASEVGAVRCDAVRGNVRRCASLTACVHAVLEVDVTVVALHTRTHEPPHTHMRAQRTRISSPAGDDDHRTPHIDCTNSHCRRSGWSGPVRSDVWRE